MNKGNTVIFALSSNVELAQEICQHLDTDLGKIDVRHFADGEILIEPLESVRGKHVYIIQSTCRPVSETYMEVLIAIDACHRASASEITLIMPYYGYARQDRKARARQPISSKLMANLLTTAGADRVVTIDLHAPQIQGFFDIPTDDLTAVAMIGQYYRNKNFTDEIVVVSPDHGGATRARKLSDTIPNSTIAIIDKRRTKPNVAEAMNLIGDVDGKVAIIIDDMIDTAGSLMGGVDMLYEKGAKAVYAACTHGILSGPALDRINESHIEEVLITNTIPLVPEAREIKKLKQISVGYMLAKCIEAIQDHTPVSSLFELFND
ncbi:ribose-phosphate pyrophosphokinase [Erysipelothrix sp. HDW6A]|uniref:ribose-phosphate diphosphokinase n=1 Tax=Erysipelothrix sp. HDW6A TaxID=2714928 RepID=UPI00140A6187|nr:ribose-phosphate pyrophosphokinase [Erysipelothrix sp. HDW6A]QIK56548.1 ribose-phosphate pyrophosphokinase [Erysipelothrix sp. HDW6A]